VYDGVSHDVDVTCWVDSLACAGIDDDDDFGIISPIDEPNTSNKGTKNFI
jgi:hypothetical protein